MGRAAPLVVDEGYGVHNGMIMNVSGWWWGGQEVGSAIAHRRPEHVGRETTRSCGADTHSDTKKNRINRDFVWI